MNGSKHLYHMDVSSTQRQGFFFQPKLKINQPDDLYEKEADDVAEKLVQQKSIPRSNTFFQRSNISTIQRKCEHCEEEPKLQRKEQNKTETEAGSELENYIGGLNGGGNYLPSATNQFFSQKIGFNFSNVKIHTDDVAAKSAESINALAYTTGKNIVFNQNQYQPETDVGKKLLAHELTHVVQQNAQVNMLQKERKKEKTTKSYNPTAGIRLLASFINKGKSDNPIFSPYNYKATVDDEEVNFYYLDDFLNKNCIENDSVLLAFRFSNAREKSMEDGNITSIGSSVDDEQTVVPEIQVEIKYRDASGFHIANYTLEDKAPMWGGDASNYDAGVWQTNFLNFIPFQVKTEGIFKIKARMINPTNHEVFLFETNFIVEKCNPEKNCFTNALATGRWVVAPLNGENIQPLTGNSPVGENYERYIDTSEDSEAYFICSNNKRVYLDKDGYSNLTLKDLKNM